MIKVRHYIQPAIVTIEVGVVCNKCGASVDRGEAEHPAEFNARTQRFHNFRVGGSFSSDFPPDLAVIEFTLCATCLRALTDSFVVPVEYLGNDPIYAKHSETLAEVTVPAYHDYALPGKVAPEDEIPEMSEAAKQRMSLFQDDVPTIGLYQHFKGGYYRVVRAPVFDWETGEAMVLYQALYGDSGYWVRPVFLWYKPASEGRERFSPVPDYL